MIRKVLIETSFVKFINVASIFLGDMRMHHVLAHNRPILSFNQCVVLRMSRTRLGLLNRQLVQYMRHHMIDIFASVVGMKVEDKERKLSKQIKQERFQKIFGYTLYASDNLTTRVLPKT